MNSLLPLLNSFLALSLLIPSWILLHSRDAILLYLNRSHLLFSFMSGLDMIKHPFSVILDPSSLVDGLLILEEVDDYLAFVFVMFEDKVSTKWEVAY